MLNFHPIRVIYLDYTNIFYYFAGIKLERNIERYIMKTEKSTEKPILTALRELEIGESCTYPAERTSYLKSACTTFGFEWGKKFTTSTNREERTVTATRIA